VGNEPRKRRWWLLPAIGILVLLAAGGGVMLWIAANMTPIARGVLERQLPGADVRLGEASIDRPGRLSLRDLVLHDPATGDELVRLERGSIEFTFEDITQGRIGELRFENPVIIVNPAWSGLLPQAPAGGGAPPSIRRIVCDYGEIRVEGADGFPPVEAKFCLDWENVMASSDEPLRLTLWDIQAGGDGGAPPFAVVDILRATGRPRAVINDFSIDSLEIKGGSLALGSVLSGLATGASPAGEPTGASSRWHIGSLDISGIRTFLGENAWKVAGDASFVLDTTLRNLTPAEITGTLGETRQTIELSDVALPSPRDPFTNVLTLRSVFIAFTLGGLLRGEVDEVSILHPVINVGEDLFLYMDRARSRLGGKDDDGGEAGSWRIERLDVHFGSIVLGGAGRGSRGLPLDFRTSLTGLSLDDLASLGLDGSLDIPSQTYKFPSYQLEVATGEGSMRFSYPPAENPRNLVSTLPMESIRWRQFEAGKSWISVTFDRTGINGSFGGSLYSGIVAGGFTFLFDPESPWIGWVSGTGIDLAEFTAVASPKNIRMSGPLDFSVQVNARAARIERLKGSLGTTAPGTMTISKIDDLLARMPAEWAGIKKSAARTALESLRDFRFDDGDGGFWFVDGQGILDLKLQGPAGSRTFRTVLHADESPEGRWKRDSQP
jgi:hypothetical protein